MPIHLLDPAETPDFDELAKLRSYLQALLGEANASLRAFHIDDTGGFVRSLTPGGSPSGKWSRSSTATCVSFLRATGRLDETPWRHHRGRLINEIVASDWNSARLGRNNPYTVAFLLEALADLGGRDTLTPAQRRTVNRKLAGLVRGVCDDNGGVRLQAYEPTAFLTYKVAVALRRWDRLDDVRAAIADWNWHHFHKESVLVASGSVDADVFEVGYSVLVASAVATLDRMTPQQRGLLRFGLGQFFSAQRPDGTWPRSRPLFVYPNQGHAYCHDYEFLSALLGDAQLRPLVFDRIECLRDAAHALDERKYPLTTSDSTTSAPFGWSSGHHGTDPRAESWATAAALSFCFGLDRLVAEGIRRATFRYAGAAYTAPLSPNTPPEDRFGKLLDAEVVQAGRSRSLKQILTEQFVDKLLAAAPRLDCGQDLGDAPISAILYGPPGTSKTELARLIASALGWPLLALDPSHLTRHGLDQVHAETNRLFGMLQRCEQVVVLLDEFDELVREREAGELESRFLTTAMLPKLTALHKEKRLVYLVATNHLERFDAAIRRPGRFDLIVPVMPPSLQAKLGHWAVLSEAVSQIEAGDTERVAAVTDALADLTYSETDDLVKELAGDMPISEMATGILHAADKGTMRQRVAASDDVRANDENWKSRVRSQEDRNRGLGF